ncbi:diguanylate cyclase [Steroidobacter sp.]|uniref:diguanylate cyclase n=1 Tax=Steroidobacter sp. TaxID=1978227 RepID=UPI001A410F1D|nr:diguanylate cyclase [Steroidobacter sp.]MBL8270407.1 GGDEF domain-containing protein [Steroidobacter sp.]
MKPPSRNTSRPTLRERFSKLLPPLSFAEPLESQYRHWHTDHARERVKYTMLPAMGVLLIVSLAGGPFRELRETLFAPEQMALVDLLRFGVLLPTCTAMLLVTYTKLYSRWLGFAAPAVSLLQSLCIVAFDLLMHRQGYSLSSVLPMLVLSAYMLFGMMQTPATITATAIVAAYGITGWAADLNTGQRLFDLAMTSFALVLGFFFHYSFSRTQRLNWFRNMMLTDSVHRDALTNIGNRRMFDVHIERLWNQAVRTRAPVALLLVDLDHFKSFNDHAGHQAGDHCLARVAGAIAQSARRPLDVAARYGGEEFVVLLFDVQRDRVEELCRELHTNLAALQIPHPASSVGPYVTVSIGAACVEPEAGRHHDGLIQLADEALYAAKEGGRNRTAVMDREYATLNTGAFRVPRSRARNEAA